MEDDSVPRQTHYCIISSMMCRLLNDVSSKWKGCCPINLWGSTGTKEDMVILKSYQNHSPRPWWAHQNGCSSHRTQKEMNALHCNSDTFCHMSDHLVWAAAATARPLVIVPLLASFFSGLFKRQSCDLFDSLWSFLLDHKTSICFSSLKIRSSPHVVCLFRTKNWQVPAVNTVFPTLSPSDPQDKATLNYVSHVPSCVVSCG